MCEEYEIVERLNSLLCALPVCVWYVVEKVEKEGNAHQKFITVFVRVVFFVVVSSPASFFLLRSFLSILLLLHCIALQKYQRTKRTHGAEREPNEIDTVLLYFWLLFGCPFSRSLCNAAWTLRIYSYLFDFIFVHFLLFVRTKLSIVERWKCCGKPLWAHAVANETVVGHIQCYIMVGSRGSSIPTRSHMKASSKSTKEFHSTGPLAFSFWFACEQQPFRSNMNFVVLSTYFVFRRMEYFFIFLDLQRVQNLLFLHKRDYTTPKMNRINHFTF